MKIAVCGSQPHSLGLAPFQDASYQEFQQGRTELYPPPQFPGQEWEIWGCSPGLYSFAPRATRWFEVHRWEPGAPWFGAGYIEFLRAFKGPVYMGGRVPEIPNCVVYPIDQVEEMFSSFFLTSSLALMLALAIMEIERVRAARRRVREKKPGFDLAPRTLHYADEVAPLPPELMRYLDEDDKEDVIGIWGVDMSAHEEYGYQRPGCQFFLLEAGRRGIGTYVPPESEIMRPMPIYGLSEWDHNYIKLTQRARQLNQEQARVAAELEGAQKKMIGLQAEQHALDYFVKTWTNPYGSPAGMILHQVPGTGLGHGVLQLDTRPVSRMTVMDPPPTAAAADTPKAGVAPGGDSKAA